MNFPEYLANTPRRRCRKLAGALVCVLLAWLPGSIVFAADDLFQQGFEAYAAGGYERAASLFGESARQSAAPGTLHNLGNAEWKCGRVGQAILAWERAQWLDYYNANTRANLRFARKAARLSNPELAWYEICSTWLPLNTWAWLAAGSFWLAVAMVILPIVCRWRKADWHQAMAAAGFAVFLLTIPALVGIQTRSNLGVVLAKDTPLRLTPTLEAQVLTRLPSGEMGRVEDQRGNYFYVRSANDAAGWIPSSQFKRICRR